MGDIAKWLLNKKSSLLHHQEYKQSFHHKLDTKLVKNVRLNERKDSILEFDNMLYDPCFNIEEKIDGIVSDPIRFMASVTGWKMVRGKFRPTLFKLIESNDPIESGRNLKKILGLEDRVEMVNMLVDAFKGVGPATASAIASLILPDCPYFSDQAAAIILGKQKILKYTKQEFWLFVEGLEELRRQCEFSGSLKELEMALWTFHEQQHQ